MQRVRKRERAPERDQRMRTRRDENRKGREMDGAMEGRDTELTGQFCSHVPATVGGGKCYSTLAHPTHTSHPPKRPFSASIDFEKRLLVLVLVLNARGPATLEPNPLAQVSRKGQRAEQAWHLLPIDFLKLKRSSKAQSAEREAIELPHKEEVG